MLPRLRHLTVIKELLKGKGRKKPELKTKILKG